MKKEEKKEKKSWGLGRTSRTYLGSTLVLVNSLELRSNAIACPKGRGSASFDKSCYSNLNLVKAPC